MSAVFDDITITWAGEDHLIKPTFALVNVIDQRTSLSVVAMQISKGEPKMSSIAAVGSAMLAHVGVYVSPEDVYVEMMNDGQDLMRQIRDAIAILLFPKRPGNVEAPSKPTKAKAKK